MTWTYDPNRARLFEGRDRLRLLIGDVLDTRPLLQDEEIDTVLALNQGAFYAACAQACDLIVAKFSGDPDFTHGRISQQRSQIVEQYRLLAQEFRTRYPSVPGQEMTVRPPKGSYFRRGMTDAPGIIDLSERDEP